MELFISHKEQFQETEMELYGKRKSIWYYCIDLLWGQKLYQELRFVLVEMSGIQNILASTSLALDPLSVIRLYSYQFRIKCTFRELKQQIGTFCYHFAKSFYLFYWKSKFQPDPLPENALQGKGFGGYPYALFSETFFPPFGEKA